MEESQCCNLFRGMSHQANPDSWSHRRRVAVFFLVAAPLKTKHTPADDHGCDDWLPSGVKQGAAGRVLGGDDDPQWGETHEEGANQG